MCCTRERKVIHMPDEKLNSPASINEKSNEEENCDDEVRHSVQEIRTLYVPYKINMKLDKCKFIEKKM